jgi:hypothetical protein
MLAHTHSGERCCAIVEELAICDSEARVDVAVINGAMHAYEIKSDRDTLKRLPAQQEQYAKCFDTVTAVVGSKHMTGIESAIPSWWGIIEAVDAGNCAKLHQRREPQINEQLDLRALIKFLWKAELIALLSSGDEHAKSLSKHSRTHLREQAVLAFSAQELSRQVREQIKARGNWRSGPTQFRSGGSSRSSAKSRHSRENRQWLLSRLSAHPRD